MTDRYETGLTQEDAAIWTDLGAFDYWCGDRPEGTDLCQGAALMRQFDRADAEAAKYDLTDYMKRMVGSDWHRYTRGVALSIEVHTGINCDWDHPFAIY